MYSGDERRVKPSHDRQGQWHLEKSFSIGNVLTIVLVIVGAVGWLWTMQTQVTTNQTALVQTIKVLDKLDARLTNYLDRVSPKD